MKTILEKYMEDPKFAKEFAKEFVVESISLAATEAVCEVLQSFGFKQKEDEDTLKPCPFCGSDEIQIVELIVPIPSGNYLYEIQCCNDSCLCDVATDEFETKEEAIKAWNKRSN